MIREVTVHVKSGTTKKSIENFGGGRFLIKTDLTDNNEINKEVIMMLSRYLGTPKEIIAIKSGENKEDKRFVIG